MSLSKKIADHLWHDVLNLMDIECISGATGDEGYLHPTLSLPYSKGDFAREVKEILRDANILEYDEEQKSVLFPDTTPPASCAEYPDT